MTIRFRQRGRRRDEEQSGPGYGRIIGLGEATAARLAAAGYAVYGTSRRGAATGQRGFEVLALDVTSNASVQAVVSEVLRRAGRIDLLVNNAGFGVGLADDEETSLAQAKAIFDTNFFGTVRMTRAVIPHMRRQGEGRVINIGSVLGFVPGRTWRSSPERTATMTLQPSSRPTFDVSATSVAAVSPQFKRASSGGVRKTS